MYRLKPPPAWIVRATYSPSVYDRLMPCLNRVRLEAGTTLYDIGSTSDHAWFITSGIVSLFTTTEAGEFIEAAAIGREGVVGLSGITKRNGMSFCAQVQISGEALHISTKELLEKSAWPARAFYSGWRRAQVSKMC
jgi:CRP-like cAMP-binding protein